MILQKIDPISLAKFLAIYGAILGLIMGLTMSISSMIATSVVKSDLGVNSPYVGIVGGLGIFSIIIMPPMYAVGSFIGGFIITILFNLIARLSGGIKLEVEQNQQKAI